MIFGRISVSRRILLVLAIGVLTPAVLSVQSLINFRKALLEARASEVRHLTEAAWSIVASYHDRAMQGSMTEDAAKEAAKSNIRALRYDGENYYFIWDLTGSGVVHGANAAFEGRNFITGPDAAKNPDIATMVTKLVAVARDHKEGFASYQIAKPGQTEPLDKIGYLKLFEPWGWAIGTGAYVTDIDANFWAKAQSDLLVAVALTTLAALISYFLGRDLSRSLQRLTAAMKRLAGGDLTQAIPAIDRTDEVGIMARTVQVFKDNALHAQQVEKDNADLQTWAAIEQERVRREAEAHSAAQAAAMVVESIGTGLERLATGDLTYRVENLLPPAYEKLRADLNRTMEQLGHLVRGILVNTAAIRSGTEDITRAADDLSRRTEHQAASLEQTAAALDQITATVQRTAEGGGQARVIAATARNDAQQAGAVVRDAVTAMGEIERSAQEITQIIGVIDEIAFQTNLLALNAGVEAARAGDAGRGFAVVASEVRALAQRSAQAAKQIKGLIGTSTVQVTNGVKLVGETGKALGRIVGQVGEINATINEIAQSAQEQSTGLHEVNAAVNQMDQVTQQNAAMVEQTTAASHALASETEALITLTNRFKIDQDEDAPNSNVKTLRGTARAPVTRQPMRVSAYHS